MPRSATPQMTRPGRVDRSPTAPACAAAVPEAPPSACGTRSRCHGSITVVAHSGRSPTIERTLSRVRAAVGQAQHVVVEAVLLVPHAVRPRRCSSPRRCSRKCSTNLIDHVLVGRDRARRARRAISSMFWLNSAIQAVPSACSRWPPVGQRRAAVEHADVVEAEEAALEHVLAVAILAVHPPGEVQQQLVERALQELEVDLRRAAPARCDRGTAWPRRAPAGSRR